MLPGDQVVVAAGPRGAAAAFFALPPSTRRVLTSSAPDAADRALIDAVDVGRVAQAHRRVVIASGDHIFPELATAMRAAGVCGSNVRLRRDTRRRRADEGS